jgi:dTDP-4-dehydrorhamnose reductase
MRLVIIGSGGRLGAALMREYREKFDLIDFNRAQLDLTNLVEIPAKFDGLNFDVLINAAALTNVDFCEKEPAQAFRINADAPRVLAEVCHAKNAKLIHFSTDYVFDGENPEPYREEDPPQPISVYGESKRVGEEKVLAVDPGHLVVRVSWVFGPDRPSFVDAVMARARENPQVDAVADKFSTPTYTVDIAEMLGRVLDDWSRSALAPDGTGVGRLQGRFQGILHLANGGSCSWQEYAQYALDCCHRFGLPLKARTVAPLKLSDMKGFIARRPVYSILATAKYTSLSGISPRPWREAVAQYIREFIAG